jgi:hypothetical protein
MICEDTPTMTGLPLDLLDQICFYLDFISILNFSLADKQCNSAANRHKFRTIRIKFSETVSECTIPHAKFQATKSRSTSGGRDRAQF